MNKIEHKMKKNKKKIFRQAKKSVRHITKNMLRNPTSYENIQCDLPYHELDVINW